MSWKHFIILVCIVAFGLTPAAGGGPATKSVTIGEYVEVPSRVLERKQTILVSLPESYEAGDQSYPVVYLLNGHVVSRFANLVSVVSIESGAGKMPEMIVVGIDTQHDYARNTFPTAIKGWPESGGADRFIRFMASELFPFVERRYRAAGFRVLIGPSNAGLQAIYAMLADPKKFGNVIAVSPSIGWCTEFMVGKLRSWSPPDGGPEPRLLIVSGSDDYADIVLPGVEAFVAELERRPGRRLEWGVEWVQDGGHVPLRGIELGISFIFDGYRFPRASYPEVGVDGIRRHYAMLSKRYAFEVPIPGTLLEDIGTEHMQRKEWQQAVAVFELWTKTDASAALPHYLMAVSLEATGELQRASEHCLKALELRPGFRAASRLCDSLSTE